MSRASFRDEKAQTMAEYAVLLAVLTAAVVTALSLLSTSVSNLIDYIVGFLA